MDPDFIEIYRTDDRQEALMIKMALEGTGIGYYLANENFSSVLPVAGVGEMRLMVEREKARDCAALLAHLGLNPSIPA